MPVIMCRPPDTFPRPPCRCFVISFKVPDTDFQQGSMLEVSDGGSLTFNGDVTFREVDSVANLLEVFGSAE